MVIEQCPVFLLLHQVRPQLRHMRIPEADHSGYDIDAVGMQGAHQLRQILNCPCRFTQGLQRLRIQFDRQLSFIILDVDHHSIQFCLINMRNNLLHAVRSRCGVRQVNAFYLRSFPTDLFFNKAVLISLFLFCRLCFLCFPGGFRKGFLRQRLLRQLRFIFLKLAGFVDMVNKHMLAAARHQKTGQQCETDNPYKRKNLFHILPRIFACMIGTLYHFIEFAQLNLGIGLFYDNIRYLNFGNFFQNSAVDASQGSSPFAVHSYDNKKGNLPKQIPFFSSHIQFRISPQP